jgi:hypothetical protein
VSELLHPTRLAWDGRRGIARHDGVQVVLAERPEGLHYHDIDYEPGIVAQCRDRACDARRDLTAEEIGAVVGALMRMAAAARRAL